MSTKYDAIKQYESDSDDEDYNVDFDESKLPLIEIPAGDHKLQHCYNLWYARKGSHRASEYSKSLHFIGRCGSVEQWWSLYCHLLRPTELKPYRKLHLFKAGIKPMWEDPENIKGGKWILRLRKNKVNRAWENVCMAMLGEQFLVGPEICGIVLSTQYPEDLLSVWNRTATDVGSTNRIRDVLKRILNLPANFPIEYKPHSDSLKATKVLMSKSQNLKDE